MKRWLAYVGLFVLVCLVSIIVHVPASAVVSRLPLPKGLALQGVQGTLWQGSAAQVRWQRDNLGEVQWDWQWLSLFKAQAEMALRFGQGSDLDIRGKGRIGYDMSGPFARNLVISASAERVTQYLSVAAPVKAQGQVELTLLEYRYGSPWCEQAIGNLVWTQSELQSPLGNLQLGPVMADFDCQQSVLNIQGNQQSVQVASEFSARLQPDRRYQVQAWFKPGAEFPALLGRQLQYLPRPDNQGRYQFSQQGRL